MHKNNPFSKTVSNHSLLHTLEEKNKAKLSKSSLSSALVRFTNGETWVCARGRSHNFYDFFFLQHVSVCVCGVLANKSFRFFFHMFEASLFCTLSHRERFWGGFKSCHFSHFVTKILASRVCWYVCVWYVFGIGFLVLFVLFLLVSWFERPRNF